MKKLTILTGGMMLAVAATGFAASSAPYKTDSQKLGYTLGYDMGKGLKKQGVSIDSAALQAGFNDGSVGSKAKMSKDDMKSAIGKYRTHLLAQLKKEHAKEMAKMEADAKTNAAKSKAYLAKVSKESGVKKLTDGVYYKVLKKGTGAVPTKSDVVTVNYKGTLMNGKVFDSSYKRHKPATFPVSAVIAGWTDALTHMPVGSTWMLYIAPSKAYGKMAPPEIGPSQALTFKVDLIKINKPAKKS